MENLLDNNFELLTNELLQVPGDNCISYFPINNNKNRAYQQNQYRGHSRSDSLLSDIRDGLSMIGVGDSLSEFANLGDIDISKINNTNSGLDRNNRIGIELGNGVDEFSSNNCEVDRNIANRNFRRLDDSFLDIDGHSINSMSLETNSDTCLYQQNTQNNNTLIHSRILNNSFTPNMHLNINRNSTQRISRSNYLEEHIDLDKNNYSISTNYRASQTEGQNNNSILTDNGFHIMNTGQFVSEFDSEQQKRIQGIVGRYNSMCVDDQLLKMGIYSNSISNGVDSNNGNSNNNITINTHNGDNTRNNDKVFLPSIDHSNINVSNSVLNGAFPHDLSNLERETSESFRGGISSSYMQRRLNNGGFRNCNMTSTTVCSEPSSLSGVVTPGNSSLNSGNSTDALSQRLRNSSNLNLNYDTDVSSSNKVNFDKLSNNNIGINGYVKQVSADDSSIILEDVSEVNSGGKIRFTRNNACNAYSNTVLGINACNHRIFSSNIVSNINCNVNNSAHTHNDNHHHGINNTNTGCSSSINNGNMYNVKRSSNNLIQSSFITNGSSSLVIDDDDIYSSIGHFVSNSTNSPQITNILNGNEGLIDNMSVNIGANYVNINNNTQNSNGVNQSESNIKGNSTNGVNNHSNFSGSHNNDDSNDNNGNHNHNNCNHCNNDNNCVQNNLNININNNSNSNVNNISNINGNDLHNVSNRNANVQSSVSNNSINGSKDTVDINTNLTASAITNNDLHIGALKSFINRTVVEESPSIEGYISPYNECSSVDSKNYSGVKGSDGGHFDITSNVNHSNHSMFGNLDASGGYRLDHHEIDEMEFVGNRKSLWNQPSYRYSGTVAGSTNIIDWKSRQLPIFEKCKFVDDFAGDMLFNNVISNRNQQKHKYFNQQKLYSFPSNINNKQQKQNKQRGDLSPSIKNFEINQRITNSFRNNMALSFSEANSLRSDTNVGRRNNRSNKKNDNVVGNINTVMDNVSLNTNISIQNVVNNGLVNKNQLQCCRKTSSPNCSVQNHINGNSFRKKSNNTIFNNCNGNSRFLSDFNNMNINNSCYIGNSTYKKGLEEFNFTNNNRNGRRNSSNHFNKGVNVTNTNVSVSNSNGVNFFSHHYNVNSLNTQNSNIRLNTANFNASSGNPNNEATTNNEASQGLLTPSSIAALWAKAMSKTGGRAGFNNRSKHYSSNYAPSGTENSENTTFNNGQSTSGNEIKSTNEIVTCARFSSFLRNNSGRLHWLRVLYHYLDTVEITKIREASKEDRNPCMVAVDDIALEAVSRSFDPSECAYWSEPENGAFVHKNIRLAVAHKVGHRTVASPQNYVNQILTASLDHSVSILLNTLRAIDDRVRWMSTVVNSKGANGFQIDIKSSKVSVDSTQKSLEPKENDDSTYTISINGNATSITSSTIEENNNDTNANVNANATAAANSNTGSTSSKNFPGRVFTVGVREAMRCLRHRKLKALIVAPDIEGDGVEGSLRHHVIHILLQAQELNIPTIFALNRHRIGRAMGKHMRMSVLGLLSIRGVEKQFQAISHTAQLLRKLYHFCVENNLPPTEETFKKLSSSINNIN